MPHHDIVIVGSGSGNSLFTEELADRDIALVEENTRWFGGTCLNVGCIPTKMFVYPAEVTAAAREAGRLGVHGGEALAPEWPAIRDRIFGRIDAISAGGRDYRRTGTPNGTLYEAHARFSGPRELTLSTGEVLTAENVVLAAGSRPVVPSVVADSGVPFHTSDSIMRLDRLPERLIVLGGGYIAAELAHVFADYGSAVTVVTRTGLLRSIDAELAARFTELVAERWHLHSDVVPTSVTRAADGEIAVELSDGRTVTGDVLLVATGRIPNGDRLDLGAGGVTTHEDGRIVVDQFQRTTADGVWALGDVSSEYQLKHVANHEERVVAHNLAHPDELIAADHRFVPSAIFTRPQLAGVGLTEAQARARGIDVAVKVQDYGSTAYGWAMEDEHGLCKLIADRASGQLVGAHLLGEQASVLIQPLIQAMSFGLGVREMARGQYWIHPALTEVVENALLGLEL